MWWNIEILTMTVVSGPRTGLSNALDARTLWYGALTCSLNYLLTYFLTPPCSRVHLENLTGPQLVKKLPTFYGTRRFITAIPRAHHLSPSWARSIQSMPSHPAAWRSILRLSCHLHLDLQSGLFPLGFPTKTLCTPLLSRIRATFPAHLTFLIIILFA
jgi:hypothetical protein